MAKKEVKVEESKTDMVFSFDNEFDQLIKSIPGIIWVDALEEERFIEDVLGDTRKIVIDGKGQSVELKKDISIYMWSVAAGLCDITSIPDPFMEDINDNQTTNPMQALDNIIKLKSGPNLAIFIMRGMGEILKVQPVVVRKLKDVYKQLYRENKILIITANGPDIPLSLDKNITYYQYKCMDRVKISELVNGMLELCQDMKKAEENSKDEIKSMKDIKVEYTSEELNNIVNACLGLSKNEIRKLVMSELNKNKIIHPTNIIKEKKRSIEKSGVLEYWESTESMNNVGGLNHLKTWLRKRKNCISDEARKFGLPVPRGILIVGVPGTGKSLCAKAVAAEWELPLIRMDVGKLMGGLVGKSEENIRKALETMDGNAPCIAWLDEIEKNLSGSASSNYSDSGTMSRVFGTFTTWLQEKKSYVFVIATANDISQLPPELTRKGRLDEIWYVGLPTENERKEIFNIQIRKYGRDPKKFDIDKLAKIVHKDENKSKVFRYTGAEIEEAIKDSLYTAFDRDPEGDMTTEDIENSLRELVPITKSEEDRINKIISEGEKKYRQASIESDAPRTTKKTVNINI